MINTLWILHLLYIYGMVTARQLDERWLQQPDETSMALRGDNLILTWLYQKTPDTEANGEISLSHHVPGNTFENMLIEGEIDPATGTIQPKFNMFSDISAWGRGNEINLQFVNLTYAINGNYLLDLRFDGQETLSDVVQLFIFEKPYWMLRPDSTNHVDQTSTLAMKWGIRLSTHTPAVLTIVFSKGLRRKNPALITCSHDKQKQAWVTNYNQNSESKHRLSLTVMERSDMLEVLIILSNTTVNDRGQYLLDVKYEGEVATLYSDVEIIVSKNFPWATTPPSTVYTVESGDIHILYIPEVSSGTSAAHNYELRMCKPTDMELAYLSVPLDAARSSSSDVRFDKRLDLRYDRRNRNLRIGMSKVKLSDTGEYMVLLSLNNDLVATHTFQLKVFEEIQLIPSIYVEDQIIASGNVSSISPGKYMVLVPTNLPAPTISFYTTIDGGTRKVYVSAEGVHKLELEVTTNILSTGDIVIEVAYSFYVYSLPLSSDVEAAASVATAGVFACVTADVNNCLLLVIVCSCLVFVCVLIIFVFAVCCCKRKRAPPTEEVDAAKVEAKANNIPVRTGGSMATRTSLRYGRVPASDDTLNRTSGTFPRTCPSYVHANNIPKYLRQPNYTPVDTHSQFDRDSFPFVPHHTGSYRPTPQPSNRSVFFDSDALSSVSSKGSRGTKITVHMTENRRERKVSHDGSERVNTSFYGEDSAHDASFSKAPKRSHVPDQPPHYHVTSVPGRDRLPTTNSNLSAGSGSSQPGSKFEVTAVKTSIVPTPNVT